MRNIDQYPPTIGEIRGALMRARDASAHRAGIGGMDPLLIELAMGLLARAEPDDARTVLLPEIATLTSRPQTADHDVAG